MAFSLHKLREMSIALTSMLVIFCTPALDAKTPSNDPTPTSAQMIAAGQKLAKDKCASCHSIEQQGSSTHKDAPPFRDFAKMWPLSSLEESLAEGIVTGHKDMPEVIFTPQQIGDFLEFLGSLETK